MLTVLCVREGGRRRTGGRRAEIQEISCKNGSFRLISLPVRRRTRALRSLARRGLLRGTVLCPASLTLPSGSFAREIDASGYRAALLANAFLRLLSPYPTASAALVDPAGRYAAIALRLLSRLRELRVVTQNEEAYAACNARAAETLGAQLMLTADPACLPYCDAVLAPEGANLPPTARPLVLGADGFSLAPGEPLLPVRFAALCPPGVDPLCFAAALASCVGETELNALLPARFARGDAVFSLLQLGNFLREIILLDKQTRLYYNV